MCLFNFLLLFYRFISISIDQILIFEGTEPQKLNNNNCVKTVKFRKLKLLKTILLHEVNIMLKTNGKKLKLNSFVHYLLSVNIVYSLFLVSNRIIIEYFLYLTSN